MGSQTEIGLIAQEVQQLVPEVIGTNSNGMLSLDYPKLTATLIKALQKQWKELKNLNRVEVMRCHKEWMFLKVR